MVKQYIKSEEIVKEDEDSISISSRASYFPFVMKKGKGSIVEDMDGNEYIDMFSSSASLNTGHSHPKVIKAIEDQIHEYIHFSNDYMYSKPQVDLAEKLIEITPGDFDKKVAFGHSGSDAIDGAIKMARSFTGRPNIISFTGSYHGSTYGAISASAISLNMKRKIGPLLPGVSHLPYPNCYRCEFNEEVETCDRECFKFFLNAFDTYIPSEEVACIIIEPIAGDLGFLKPPLDYMQRLDTFCKERGILLIVDEVQQGFGRTGKWFSIEHFGIVPDILVMGKAMGSGLPISAIVASTEIVDSLEMPAHLFTMQGNATCSVASLATINIIEEEDLIENSIRIGSIIKKRFLQIKENYPVIGDVRGEGLSIGVELVKDRETLEKDKTAAIKICHRLWERGVLMIFLAGNILRVQPSLVITEEEVNKALDIIDEVVQEYSEGKISDQALEVVKGW